MSARNLKYGIVVFYKMNRNHTMTEIGRTSVLDAFTALNVFANVPNPESQLLQDETIQGLQEQYDRLSANVLNPDFVEQKILPCL